MPVSKSLAIAVTNHTGPKELHWRQKKFEFEVCWIWRCQPITSHSFHWWRMTRRFDWPITDLINNAATNNYNDNRLIETHHLGYSLWFDGLYREVAPKRGTFFRLQVYERIGISLVEVYKRVVKSFFWVCKKGPNNRRILWLQKGSIFVIDSYLRQCIYSG